MDNSSGNTNFVHNYLLVNDTFINLVMKVVLGIHHIGEDFGLPQLLKNLVKKTLFV